MQRRIICKTKRLPKEPVFLLEYLAGRFTYFDYSEWMGEIAAGRVLINQEIATCQSTLFTGDTIEYLPLQLQEPTVETNFRIIHEDEHLLVIDKPANLPCHPRGRYFRNTLWGLLKTDRREGNFHFINRLDRETSGLVLLAKDSKTAALCQQQFKDREVHKKYLALVRGRFPGRMELTGYLYPARRTAIRHKQEFSSVEENTDVTKSRRVKTKFLHLQFENGISLIEALPITGRQHQIRASLEYLGYPLVGDKLYGCKPEIFHRFIADQLTMEDKKLLWLPRHALHAAEIGLTHPLSGEKMFFSSPLPEDIKTLLSPRVAFLPWQQK